MTDKSTIKSKTALETQKTGQSLAATLYDMPVTIALNGELGSGKTTFLQGFAAALGCRETLVSPTYALEQRYRSTRGEFLHLDLYRLTEPQAKELLHSCDTFTGIRCIEWFDRAGLDHLLIDGPVIAIHLEEADRERTITCAFHDAPLPSPEQIRGWRRDVLLPTHIGAHCDAVADLSVRLADALIERGHIVRNLALRRAAEVHDLFRFLDFRPGGHPENNHSAEAQMTWEKIRAQYRGMHHEAACAQLLRERGFSVLSTIVAVHGLSAPPPPDATIEQQLLFYADKRVQIDRVVSLDERFADFARRYGKGTVSEEAKRWYGMTKEMELELFPDGPPL